MQVVLHNAHFMTVEITRAFVKNERMMGRTEWLDHKKKKIVAFSYTKFNENAIGVINILFLHGHRTTVRYRFSTCGTRTTSGTKRNILISKKIKSIQGNG